MFKRVTFLVFIVSSIGQLPTISIGSEQEKVQASEGTQEQAYGWELMTPEERTAHRDQMRSLKTEEERRAFQTEHHQRMLERAKERGVTLSDAPRTRRYKMGKDATEEQSYGWELMTPEERTRHRDQMRALKTEEERRTFQLEHHRKMSERAKERGVSLSDSPRSQRRGSGLSEGKTGGGGSGGRRG